jgi:hypothetical protein
LLVTLNFCLSDNEFKSLENGWTLEVRELNQLRGVPESDWDEPSETQAGYLVTPQFVR